MSLAQAFLAGFSPSSKGARRLPSILKSSLRKWDPPEDAVEEFARRVAPALQVVFETGAENADEEHDLGISWDHVNPAAAEFARQRGAEMIGRRWAADGTLVENPSAYWSIEATTRSEINELLSRAIEEGWSPSRFERYLEGTGIFEPWRADMIARTEIATAQNAGAIRAMREADVEYVVVSDGDYDEECAAVDGAIWTLEEAEAEPLAHPNCLRAFRPATKEEAREAAEEEDEED